MENTNTLETVYCSPEALVKIILALDPFQTPANEDDYILAGMEDDMERARR